MGETEVRVRVIGSKGSAEFEAMVDTGATFTKIPKSSASEAGIEPKYEVDVKLVDGRVVQRMLGLADVELEGVRRPVLVAVSPDGERPILGYTALENLGFKVNPITRRLERARAVEY